MGRGGGGGATRTAAGPLCRPLWRAGAPRAAVALDPSRSSRIWRVAAGGRGLTQEVRAGAGRRGGSRRDSDGGMDGFSERRGGRWSSASATARCLVAAAVSLDPRFLADLEVAAMVVDGADFAWRRQLCSGDGGSPALATGWLRGSEDLAAQARRGSDHASSFLSLL